MKRSRDGGDNTACRGRAPCPSVTFHVEQRTRGEVASWPARPRSDGLGSRAPAGITSLGTKRRPTPGLYSHREARAAPGTHSSVFRPHIASRRENPYEQVRGVGRHRASVERVHDLRQRCRASAVAGGRGFGTGQRRVSRETPVSPFRLADHPRTLPQTSKGESAMTSCDRPYGGERASEDACTSARRTSARAVFERWRGIRAGECGLRASVSVDEHATERGPESRADPPPGAGPRAAPRARLPPRSPRKRIRDRPTLSRRPRTSRPTPRNGVGRGRPRPGTAVNETLRLIPPRRGGDDAALTPGGPARSGLFSGTSSGERSTLRAAHGKRRPQSTHGKRRPAPAAIDLRGSPPFHVKRRDDVSRGPWRARRGSAPPARPHRPPRRAHRRGGSAGSASPPPRSRRVRRHPS